MDQWHHPTQACRQTTWKGGSTTPPTDNYSTDRLNLDSIIIYSLVQFCTKHWYTRITSSVQCTGLLSSSGNFLSFIIIIGWSTNIRSWLEWSSTRLWQWNRICWSTKYIQPFKRTRWSRIASHYFTLVSHSKLWDWLVSCYLVICATKNILIVHVIIFVYLCTHAIIIIMNLYTDQW